MPRLFLTILAALAGLLLAGPATACTVAPAVTSALGDYSPPAVKAGAVPALRSRAGLTCSPGVLVLLGGNYIKATFKSQNAMKLARVGDPTRTIGYVLSADPDGKFVAAQDATIDYMQNNLLNLLGLLGGSSADLPFFVKPSGGTFPLTGTYTDRVTIKWDWYICQGLGALGACLLGADSGTGTTVVDVTLTVTPKSLVVTTSSVTTWDPVNTTTNPRAVPGSRQRVSVTVTNPDIVAAEPGLSVTIPIAARQQLDLASEGVALQPGASTLALTYTDGASTSDDVDFSADNGTAWTFAPTLATQGSVTTLRVRPRGSMAAGSSFTVTMPAAVR